MIITEQWLKDNGWDVHHYTPLAISDRLHYATKMFGNDKVLWNDKWQITIFRDYEVDSDVYADCLIDKVETVEKLNAALELCDVRED